MDDRLSVSTSQGLYFFSPDEIIRLEASSNYTDMHFTNRRPLRLAKVLKDFSSILEPLGFIRTHRSHLVNRNFIVCVRATEVVMQDSSIAEISRRKKSTVKQILKAALWTRS